MPQQAEALIGQGGLLGGIAVLVVAVAWAIKTGGPEVRCWFAMFWARSDARRAAQMEAAAERRLTK